MDAEERRKVEAAMAQISRDKQAVEADPAGLMQRSIDATIADAKSRLLRMILWIVTAAVVAGMVFYWLRY